MSRLDPFGGDPVKNARGPYQRLVVAYCRIGKKLNAGSPFSEDADVPCNLLKRELWVKGPMDKKEGRKFIGIDTLSPRLSGR